MGQLTTSRLPLWLAVVPWKSLCLSTLVVGVAIVSNTYRKSVHALHRVEQCRTSMEVADLTSDSRFDRFARSLGHGGGVLMLNSHALDMTLNWLCNTVDIEGVHKSVGIVVFDAESYRTLQNRWPTIATFYWNVPCLRTSFGYGDPTYQVFMLARINLSIALLRKGYNFWMIQQDTFWKNSLFASHRHLLTDAADLYVDRTGLDLKMVGGGYFYANSTEATLNFFERLRSLLLTRYAPDNVLMTSLCSEDGIVCSFLPYRTVTNWRWLMTSRNEEEPTPSFIQFDGQTGSQGGKLQAMADLGLRFFCPDDDQCSRSTAPNVHLPVLVSPSCTSGCCVGRNVSSALRLPPTARLSSLTGGVGLGDLSQWQLNFYVTCVEWFYMVPGVERFFNRYVLVYAYYLMPVF